VNDAVLDHNHELSRMLKEASSLNQFLGAELCKIGQELHDLEEQLEIEAARITRSTCRRRR
jgi:hypothetical protein